MSGAQLGKEASGVPPTDLSGLFGALSVPAAAAVPDRTEGIPQLTAPPNQRAEPISRLPEPAVIEQAAADQAVASMNTASGRQTVSRSPKASRRRHPSSVVIYLSVSLRQRLRHDADATGRSYTQIVFAGLNNCHNRLGELATKAGQQPAEPPVDGLFVVQRSGRRVHAEDQVQVSIRPNPTNLAVIDELAKQHTHKNRSALIALALDDYLPAATPEPHSGMNTG